VRRGREGGRRRGEGKELDVGMKCANKVEKDKVDRNEGSILFGFQSSRC